MNPQRLGKEDSEVREPGGFVIKASQEGTGLPELGGRGGTWSREEGCFVTPDARSCDRVVFCLAWDRSPGWVGCGVVGRECEVRESPASAPSSKIPHAECSGGLGRPQAMGHRVPGPALP